MQRSRVDCSSPRRLATATLDRAIAFQEGTVKHVYFVAETTGWLSSMELTVAEAAKIECARKFLSLRENVGSGVVEGP